MTFKQASIQYLQAQHDQVDSFSPEDREIYHTMMAACMRTDITKWFSQMWDSLSIGKKVVGVNKKQSEFRKILLDWIISAPTPIVDKRDFMLLISVPSEQIPISKLLSFSGPFDQLVSETMRQNQTFKFIMHRTMTLAASSKDGRGEYLVALLGREGAFASTKTGGDVMIDGQRVEIKSADRGASIKGDANKRHQSKNIDDLTEDLAAALHVHQYVPIRHRPKGSARNTIKSHRARGLIFDAELWQAENPFVAALSQLHIADATKILTPFYTGLYGDKPDTHELIGKMLSLLGTDDARICLIGFILTRSKQEWDVLMILNETNANVVCITDTTPDAIKALPNNISWRLILQRGGDTQAVPDGYLNVRLR